MISIIAAIGENRELGKNGKLLWHIPEDMKRFKKLTTGHVVIMGRKTFESIGKPLPNRINIVISRNIEKIAFASPSLIACSSLETAIKLAKKLNTYYSLLNTDEIFIIGGGQIYQQAIKYVDKLYLTIVKGIYPADVFFPDYSGFNKILLEQTSQDKLYSYTFLELER